MFDSIQGNKEMTHISNKNTALHVGEFILCRSHEHVTKQA